MEGDIQDVVKVKPDEWRSNTIFIKMLYSFNI